MLDSNKIQNIAKKNPNRAGSNANASEEMGQNQPSYGFATTEEIRHNSGIHAIYYLNLIAYSLVYGMNEWSDNLKPDRLLAHLYCLKATIEDEEKRVYRVVTTLIHNLKILKPDCRKDWERFIYENIKDIFILARTYRSKFKYLRQFMKMYEGREGDGNSRSS